MMAQCSEDELYQKADNLLRNAGQHFQSLFLQRWELFTQTKWNGKDSAQILVDMLGIQFSKILQPLQKKQVRKGLVEEWDISLLSRLLLHFNKDQENAKNNQAIHSITNVRNKLAHNGKKKLTFEEYNLIENQVRKNLIILGMDEKAIQKIINLAEATSMNSALEQLKKLQVEGDDLFNKKCYEKAIQIYSDAMILPNLPSGYLSILHEKRASCHFSLSQKNSKLREEKLDLAFSDAEKAIALNSESWKGHHILALINQGRSKMDEAEMHFRFSLAISPGQPEVKSDFDACKILAGKIARNEHMDPLQMPMNLSERVKHFNDETGHSIGEETFLKLGKIGGKLFPGHDHVQTGHQHVAGWGVPQNYSEAARHYAKAAKVGNAEGMYNLACLYKDGLGVKRDIPHAMELLLEASSKPVDIKNFGMRNLKDVGVLAAQHSLGLMHEEGVGFPKDKVKAAFWYKKAADNGCGNAANNLAIMYSRGDHIPLDEKMAEMYWKIAVADKNVNAAYSLHLYYVREMEPQLAKSYFNTAIELGHDRLKASKAQVFEMLVEMEKDRRKSEGNLKAFEKANKLSPKGLTFSERMKRQESITNPEMAQLFGDLDELMVGENRAPQKWAGKAKTGLDITELMWKADQGSKTAQLIITCLENKFKFVEMWEQGIPKSRSKIEKLINTLYLCLTTAGHHLNLAKEMHMNVLKFVTDLFRSIGGEQSVLDMQLRLCISVLNFGVGGVDELHAEVLEEGLRRYPDEIPLYRNLADAYGNLKKHSKGLQVANKGLLKAANDPDLLYGKAVHLRLMDETGVNQLEVRKAYKQFVEKSHADHRKLPEGYYGIALTYMAEMATAQDMKSSGEMLRHYYGLGEQAEKAQLSCYLPYDSSCKVMLKPILMMMTNDGEKLSKAKNEDMKRVGGVRGVELEPSKLYLTNPKRIGMIKKHREMAEGIRKDPMKGVLTTKAPKLVHKIPKSLTDLQTIALQEINPTKDMIYEGRILNLTLIEEPNFGFPSIHSIAEDDNGEATRLYIYNVEQNEQSRKTFWSWSKDFSDKSIHENSSRLDKWD